MLIPPAIVTSILLLPSFTVNGSIIYNIPRVGYTRKR